MTYYLKDLELIKTMATPLGVAILYKKTTGLDSFEGIEIRSIGDAEALRKAADIAVDIFTKNDREVEGTTTPT